MASRDKTASAPVATPNNPVSRQRLFRRVRAGNPPWRVAGIAVVLAVTVSWSGPARAQHQSPPLQLNACTAEVMVDLLLKQELLFRPCPERTPTSCRPTEDSYWKWHRFMDRFSAQCTDNLGEPAFEGHVQRVQRI